MACFENAIKFEGNFFPLPYINISFGINDGFYLWWKGISPAVGLMVVSKSKNVKDFRLHCKHAAMHGQNEIIRSASENFFNL